MQRLRNQRKVLRLRNPNRSGDKPHLMVFRTLHKAAFGSRASLVANGWKAQVPPPKQRGAYISYACVRSKFTLKKADKTSKKAVQVQGEATASCGSVDPGTFSGEDIRWRDSISNSFLWGKRLSMRSGAPSPT